MGSVFLIAGLLGRQRDGAVALVFAAAVMVGIEPQILWNISFQLSFLSMAGLVFVLPAFQSWCRNKIGPPSAATKYSSTLYKITIDSLCVTIVAILATAPIIAWNFGTFSLVALPANFFSIPSLPPIIIFAALVSITGVFIPILAQILGWITWLFITYFILIIQIFNELPFPALTINNLSTELVSGYYILLISFLLILNNRSKVTSYFTSILVRIEKSFVLASKIPFKVKKWSLVSLLILVVLVWTIVANIPDDKLHISFLDVGQGDAILIQTPHHQNILIDGGPSPQSINLELGKKLPFWNRTIDLVILTQPQSDHVTGLVEVLHKFKVQKIISSTTTNESFIYSQWLNTIQSSNINNLVVHSNQNIRLGNDLYVEVLHPPKSGFKSSGDNINNNGLILRLNYHAVSFLFTADISEEVEHFLISQRENLQSTVLKVAHHGSITSSSEEVLSVIDPEIAIISAGTNNLFNHPNSLVFERLKQRLGNDRLFLTQKHGTIEVETDGKKLWVKTER